VLSLQKDFVARWSTELCSSPACMPPRAQAPCMLALFLSGAATEDVRVPMCFPYKKISGGVVDCPSLDTRMYTSSSSSSLHACFSSQSNHTLHAGKASMCFSSHRRANTLGSLRQPGGCLAFPCSSPSTIFDSSQALLPQAFMPSVSMFACLLYASLRSGRSTVTRHHRKHLALVLL
jgi:hypothetical protein